MLLHAAASRLNDDGKVEVADTAPICNLPSSNLSLRSLAPTTVALNRKMLTGASMIAFCILAFASLAAAYDDNFDLAVAQRYVDFAGAAYCADPIFADESITDWTCKVCAKYPGVTATTFHAKGTDANGFVAYDPSKNEIIVSFSGTDPFSIRAWIDDLDTRKMVYPHCSGCEVHEGFYRTYLSVQDQILSTVKNLRTTYSSATVAVTGHSLGASLTAHCIADLTVNGYKVSTGYAFGMPRVGNEAFEKWYVSVVPGTFRVTHGKDPVPHLPPMNWGFHHMPYEVFYTKDYNKWKLCSFEGEDETCGNQDAVNLRVDDHLDYLGFSFTTNYLSCQRLREAEQR